MTTQSNKASSISAEESVTTIHVEEQFDGKIEDILLVLLKDKILQLWLVYKNKS